VAVALALASGATDIASFTRLGGVFSSVMTGNLVLVGAAAERASGGLAGHAGVAFAGYIAGVALGSRICGGTRSEGVLWPPPVTLSLLVEFVALAVFAVGWELAGSHPLGASQLGLLAVTALAMGLQSEAVRNIGTSLSTTYLTGTLTGAVASIFTRGQPRHSNGLDLAVIVAAGAGAAAGGGVIASVPAMMPVLPMVALAGVITFAITVGIHQ
jgi:uncharacterized membrane protein YoaK (UPF0700 family)